jgi:hypothetical protein
VIAPDGRAIAPAHLPRSVRRAVRQMIDAGNRIVGRPGEGIGGGHLPYPRASSQTPSGRCPHTALGASTFDGSGAVSYVLNAADFRVRHECVSQPMDTVALEQWGLPGPGRWVTVRICGGSPRSLYGHATIEIAGVVMDTETPGPLPANSPVHWRGPGPWDKRCNQRHPAGL